jgi:methylmalonyl-CoA mutase cobalamin-binding domain/chain
MGDVALVVGGIIPEEDAAELLNGGYADQVFTPGDPLDKITGYISGIFSSHRRS